MEAKDLMQFDWICLEDDPTPRQVDFIRSGEVGLYWNKIVTPPYIKPISLTPEILEKNGFEKMLDEDDTKYYCYYSRANDGYIKISLYNGGDGDWNINIINYKKFDDNAIVYNNNFIFLKVHQLQHALRLCEITKEIEL